MTRELLELGEIPFFGSLDAVSRANISKRARLQTFRRGDVVCRRGERGSSFYAIARGGVAVVLEGSPEQPGRCVFLGLGQVFGEMSILSDQPVSATIVAVSDTAAWAIASDDFLELLDTAPQLQRSLIHMLVARLRHRTGQRGQVKAPSVALLSLPEGRAAYPSLARQIARGVAHYAPGSMLMSAGTGATTVGLVVHVPAENIPDVISDWRSSHKGERYLLILSTQLQAKALGRHLERDDVLLRLEPEGNEDGLADSGIGGLFERGYAAIVGPDDEAPPEGPWRFRVPAAELEAARAVAGSDWDREALPTLDWIARWITCREVGIAMGSGAARGFAHLGVLDVLEEHGIRVDFACGSSIGGIVALVYGVKGSARDAIERTRRAIGSNRKIRDVSWSPRAGFLVGKKVRQAAAGAAAERTFAQLARPAAAVSADLVSGTRHVLEEGKVAPALVATSAIPGLYPPMEVGDALLVDGALVSRIPVDLLDRRRCGLKIAVNVVPSPAPSQSLAADKEHLTRRTQQLLGFRTVIGKSWELLGWWHGAQEAEQADILLEPVTDRYAGFDFDSFDEMIEVGRRTTRERLQLIQRAYEAMLEPGAP